MSYFKVSSQELRNKAERLTELNNRFNQSVEKLVDQEGSLATMWEGDAQKAFRAAFNTDRQKFNEFYKGIQKYVQALLEAAKRYEQAEDKNREIAKSR